MNKLISTQCKQLCCEKQFAKKNIKVKFFEASEMLSVAGVNLYLIKPTCFKISI